MVQISSDSLVKCFDFISVANLPSHTEQHVSRLRICELDHDSSVHHDVCSPVTASVDLVDVTRLVIEVDRLGIVEDLSLQVLVGVTCVAGDTCDVEHHHPSILL